MLDRAGPFEFEPPDKRPMLRDSRGRRAVVATLAFAFCVGVGLAASEIAAALYLWRSTGRLVWLAAPEGPSRNVFAVIGERLKLNPYYGYMETPGLKMTAIWRREDVLRQFGQRYVDRDFETQTVNTYGFWSNYDYPHNDDRAFIIGVFGGSVAEQFALTMEPILRSLLSGEPRLHGRRLVLLNFANGAAKQPQQVTTLGYFLALGQRFDLILNLDGFNEMYIGWLNAVRRNTDERMPFAPLIYGIQNIMLESYGAITGDNRIPKLRGWRDAAAEQLAQAQPALLHVWRQYELRGARKALARLEQNLSTAESASSYAMPLVSRSSPTDEASRDNTVSTWINGSIAMAGMARAYAVPYLHVLQPNQYFTKARFTDEQRRRTLNLAEPPIEILVPAYYSQYRARAAELTGRRIAFLDATPVFDEADASVFADNCCHFTEAGNEMLAAKISDAIRDVLR